MTANQLRYWELQETKRSNTAREAETHRSNLAQEAETNRHNVSTEGIQTEANAINRKANVGKGFQNVSSALFGKKGAVGGTLEGVQQGAKVWKLFTK